MNLQLAESAGMTAGQQTPSTKPYIFVPGQIPGRGTYIREDLLDALPRGQYEALIRKLAPHQREVKNGMSEAEFLASKTTRKAKRAQKATDKHDKKASKIELRKSKAAAKLERAKSGKGRAAAKDALDFSKSLIKSKVGGGGGGGADDPNEEKPWYKTTGGMIGIGAGVLLLTGVIAVAVRKPKKK